MTYSNPRMEATVENWPSGRHTVTAQFSIETHNWRGQRAVRVTTGKPKKLTYAKQVRIVDGDDGRIYLAELSHYGQSISIMRGTMDIQHEWINESDPRHAEMLALFQLEPGPPHHLQCPFTFNGVSCNLPAGHTGGHTHGKLRVYHYGE